MEITVYFEGQPLYLCDELSPKLKEILAHPDAIFIDELSTAAIKTLLHEVNKEEFHAGVILHHDFEALKKAFFKHFVAIEAAGGVVQNAKKEILFIYRLERWDLPKGKIEIDEKADEAAVREIEEETGVNKLVLKNLICETYHVYKAFGKTFVKTTHWFYFSTTYEGKSIAQTEENITAVKWWATKDIKIPVATIYPAIRDVLTVFFDKP